MKKPWRSFPLPVVHATWTVDLFKERPVVDGDVVQGYCDFAKRRIGIWLNPNELALRSAFWHEFGHAMLYENGHEDAADNDGFVESMALAIMGVRTKVPWL